MIAKRLVSQGLKNDRDWGLVWSILNDSQLMLAALFLPAVLLSIGGLTGGSLQPLATWPASLAFALYLLVLIVLLASYVLIARHVAATEKGSMALSLSDLNTAVIVAGSPLTLIPLGGLLANELQFAVPAASPRALGLAVVVLLAAISLTLFILQRRGRLKISGVAILGSFYFPVTVATLASLQTHLWTLNLTSLDSPHLGGRILPTQQWAEFGSLPFLDLLPGQGLADVAVQTLYVWIHGVRGLDFLIWLPWIPVVVGFLIVYAYLATVTSPLLALLVTLFLPVGFLVVGQYAVALLPAVLLAVALRKPDFKRFLALWLTTVALLLWRPALGGPAGVAIVLVVMVVVLLDHRELVVPASTSLAVVLGLLPVGLVVAELIWAGDTYSALGGFLGALPATGLDGRAGRTARARPGDRAAAPVRRRNPAPVRSPTAAFRLWLLARAQPVDAGQPGPDRVRRGLERAGCHRGGRGDAPCSVVPAGLPASRGSDLRPGRPAAQIRAAAGSDGFGVRDSLPRGVLVSDACTSRNAPIRFSFRSVVSPPDSGFDAVPGYPAAISAAPGRSQLLVADGVTIRIVAQIVAILLFEPGVDGVDVEAVGVVGAAAQARNRDDLGAEFRSQARRDGTDRAESLHDHTRTRQRTPLIAAGLPVTTPGTA